MTVFYKEFQTDDEAIAGIHHLKQKGILDTEIFVLTHEDQRTDSVADRADANVVGASETGIGTAAANVFRKKGDELRAQFEELGFTAEEAEALEEKLDEQRIIVVVKDIPEGFVY